jgi:hypothetical protein
MQGPADEKKAFRDMLRKMGLTSGMHTELVAAGLASWYDLAMWNNQLLLSAYATDAAGRAQRHVDADALLLHIQHPTNFVGMADPLQSGLLLLFLQVQTKGAKAISTFLENDTSVHASLAAPENSTESQRVQHTSEACWKDHATMNNGVSRDLAGRPDAKWIASRRKAVATGTPCTNFMNWCSPKFAINMNDGESRTVSNVDGLELVLKGKEETTDVTRYHQFTQVLDCFYEGWLAVVSGSATAIYPGAPCMYQVGGKSMRLFGGRRGLLKLRARIVAASDKCVNGYHCCQLLNQVDRHLVNELGNYDRSFDEICLDVSRWDADVFIVKMKDDDDRKGGRGTPYSRGSPRGGPRDGRHGRDGRTRGYDRQNDRNRGNVDLSDRPCYDFFGGLKCRNGGPAPHGRCPFRHFGAKPVSVPKFVPNAMHGGLTNWPDMPPVRP